MEHVVKKPRRQGDSLGTVQYEPSKAEKPFFDKLAPEEVTTGGLTGEYHLASKDGTYVGWFGIVREVTEDEDRGLTTLLVEHKYFDGLTDAHIQAVSFNGSGDFAAELSGTGLGIEPLGLVKVYGQAAVEEGKPPRVVAAFVRDWHWGTSTFMAAWGEQRGSEKWRKLNRVPLDDIYEPYPNDEYYELRLGKRPKEE